ncbi:GGDEF domain-containing protein [Pseudomonas donghuensis]|uniref:Diguanylate cyclase n=1 Tax=Pseudomonas donghuensis TaxID=1163398 RepID=A0AAP0SE83_9PSED|nr:GGDEF domain-containing protein [Pseudomonas donghuensis]MDF9894132.1 diguanylate cyclase (GGDEF)-like protein/PAS domain S-box-containing protein [Pseudomonas vranovensis]KDN98827.2 diguanylate cyclase [Pseudomonas donghuensis]MBF4211048.1 sensor domain-containing diguanylate cyclase [Pseudomonas donghuensis]MCP6693641.1 diguanylate cyclase [Pseudomonas donghuensis]UVL22456.1 diguanylate cyclase [Pseudomonas donghuensis]
MPIDLQALYPKLIHLMLDTVFVVDRDNQIVFVSDACEALLGYGADELTGTPITDYIHPDDLAVTRASIVRVMNGHSHVDFRNRYIRKDGGVVHILWAAFWSEEVGARIGVARDVTALRQAEDELRFLAHHDPLTALTNRSLFNQRMESALRAAQHHQSTLALLFLDINDFKGINDVHGHAMGDRILCTIARRLERCVRETDTVARMGGDEFTVLLPGIQSHDAVYAKVEQILAAMAEPLGAEFGGIKMPSCSVGVAFYPKDAEDADTLLSHADGDMYRVKKQRGAQLISFKHLPAE